MRTLAVFLSLLGFAIAYDNFTMSVSPPPTPGQPFTITWTPSSTNKINMLLNNFDPSNPSLPIITTSDTIAYSLPNNGSWTWNVPSTLCGRHSFSIEEVFERPLSFSQIFTINTPACTSVASVTVYPTTVACTTSRSTPVLTTLGPAATITYIPGPWLYPVVGQPATIWWIPSAPSTVILQVNYGAIPLPDGSNVIYLSKSAPNNGSFVWNVPSDFVTGEYVLATIDGKSQALEVIIVGKVTPTACAAISTTSTTSRTSSPGSSTTTKTSLSSSHSSFNTQSVIVDTVTATVTGAASPVYAQILKISTCPTSIVPSYTSIIAAGTTTSFPFVGCSATGSSATASIPATCQSGLVTFAVNSSSSVCCPSAWKTSSMDQMYCFTSASVATTTAAKVARQAQSSATTQPTVVVISNLVFAKAAVVSAASRVGGIVPGLSLVVIEGLALMAVLVVAL